MPTMDRRKETGLPSAGTRCDYAAAPVVLVDEAPKDIPAYVSLRPLREGPP